MGAPEITQFLSSLAVEGKVAASTQNQALSALLFLYRDVLEQELPWLDDLVRAKRPRAAPRRAHPRRGPRRPRASSHGVPRLMAHAPLRRRPAPARMPAPARQGRRLRGGTRSSCAAARGTRTGDDAAGRRESRSGPAPRGGRASTSAISARRRLGRAAVGPGAQVPERRPRVALAVGVPGHPDLRGPRHRPAPPPPPARVGAPARGPGGRHRGRHRRSGPPATPSATRSPPTCWRTATTSGPSRSCWATATSARR